LLADGAVLDDDTIKRGNNPPSPTLFVSGLSRNTDERMLKAAFEGCKNVKIIKEFGRSRG